jgi:hypothetical protein
MVDADMKYENNNEVGLINEFIGDECKILAD